MNTLGTTRTELVKRLRAAKRRRDRVKRWPKNQAKNHTSLMECGGREWIRKGEPHRARGRDWLYQAWDSHWSPVSRDEVEHRDWEVERAQHALACCERGLLGEEDGCTLRVEHEEGLGDRYVMESPLTGRHSLDVQESDAERLRAHWRGFRRPHYDALAKATGGDDE